MRPLIPNLFVGGLITLAAPMTQWQWWAIAGTYITLQAIERCLMTRPKKRESSTPDPSKMSTSRTGINCQHPEETMHAYCGEGACPICLLAENETLKQHLAVRESLIKKRITGEMMTTKERARRMIGDMPWITEKLTKKDTDDLQDIIRLAMEIAITSTSDDGR